MIALIYHQDTLEIIRESGDKKEEMLILNRIGAILDRTRDHNRAMNIFQEALGNDQDALSISEDIGDKVVDGISLNHRDSSLWSYR